MFTKKTSFYVNTIFVIDEKQRHITKYSMKVFHVSWNVPSLYFMKGSERKISQFILSSRNYKMILYLQIIVIRGNFNNHLSIMTNIPSWTLLKNYLIKCFHWDVWMLQRCVLSSRFSFEITTFVVLTNINHLLTSLTVLERVFDI